MKNYRFQSYIFFVLVLIVASCQSSLYPDQVHEPVVIEGELVFKLITLPNLYGVPPSVASEFMQTTENEQIEDASLRSRSFAVHFRTLEGSGLLHKPYFQLRTKDKETFTVYVSDEEYEKVREFRYADLRRSREKVTLTLRGLFVDGVVDCDEILQVKRTAGLTIYDK